METNPVESAYDVTQEVRIASVMYGGVSLAIYMNGITQELLRAVRSTAPRQTKSESDAPLWAPRKNVALLPDAELRSTESVYRKIGRGVFHGRKAGHALDAAGPIQTRIVVDILAGTSAGGINSVYLAKALANNYSLDELKQLWMTEANIDTLLNDAGSEPGTYPAKKPPTSLLNSQRMYGILLQAFENMDLKQTTGQPLADELDLFITTTDLNGVATPVQLADTTITERIHKASFHFVFGPGRAGKPNDFTRQFNPMLAFASRCTSSFPVAFEPMKALDLDDRIPGLSLQVSTTPDHPFRKFFAQFERNNPELPFVWRPLADGGYLNNKPFSFITEQIKVRTGSSPVVRKLLFLDPFPELSREARHTTKDINFVDNSLDAAFTLPRYQTIREDIERLNDYNRGIRAAQGLASEIEAYRRDIWTCVSDAETKRPLYQNRTQRDMREQYGICYLTYHRLRVSAVTTDLAHLLTRLLDLNEQSDYLFAIRMLIHSWRVAHYSPDGGDGKLPENHFLFEFDLGFRSRRADYVHHSIDRMLKALARPDEEHNKTLVDLIQSGLPAAENSTVVGVLQAHIQEARDELFRLRDVIERVKWGLMYERERLLLDQRGLTGAEKDDADRKALIQAITDTGLGPEDLKRILRPLRDDECQAVADGIYNSREVVRNNIDRSAVLISAWLKALLTDGSVRFRRELSKAGGLTTATGIVQAYVAAHWEYFDCRDMQIFTALQDQLEGEGALVEIYRVSPLDATRLRTDADPSGEGKLAGAAVFAFGAFLDEHWRANDMMWGRLDGAERIISALLPDAADAAQCDALCAEAFRIILSEEFTPTKCADLVRPLMGFLRKRLESANTKKSLTQMNADEFLQLAMQDTAENCPALIQELLKAITNDNDRLTAFRAYYVRPADPPVDQSLDRLRRALGIFRGMLQGFDGGNGPASKIAGPLAGFGAALARFAEFSVPQTWPNVFLRYWVQVVYAVSIVLIVVGTLFYKEAETAGWVALGLAATANVLSWLIARALRGAPIVKRVVGTIAALVVLAALFTLLLVRLQCYLPAGAWKAPLNSLAHMMDNRCASAVNP